MAAFDSNDDKVGSLAGDLEVHAMEDLPNVVVDLDISIGVVAVPSPQAQTVINQMVENGIKGILNYAPVAPYVPRGDRGAQHRPGAVAPVDDVLFEEYVGLGDRLLAGAGQEGLSGLGRRRRLRATPSLAAERRMEAQRPFEVHVGHGGLRTFLRALQRGLGAFDVDLVSLLRGVG